VCVCVCVRVWVWVYVLFDNKLGVDVYWEVCSRAAAGTIADEEVAV